MSARNHILKIINLHKLSARCFSGGRVIYTKPSSATTSQPEVPLNNVTGLSDAVLRVPNEPVGPGASKNTDYKNPEYFSYHSASYFEAEIEMLKYRIPQPSNKRQ